MVSEIKEEVVDGDDSLEEDFKAEAISSENMVGGAGGRWKGRGWGDWGVDGSRD
jgi:hypothetical protein